MEIRRPEIIYTDENLIVVNKPAGMPVHEAKHSDDYTLCDWLLAEFPEIKDVGDTRANENVPYRPGIVHRLDKQTSGVMVITRNQASFLKLKDAFKSRRVEKIYTALVCGRLKEKAGVIAKPVGRLTKTPMKMGVNTGQGGTRLAKEAVTEYKVLKEFKDAALIEVRPKTGRMHQIRVHLASIGHPVAGDAVYGGKKVCFAELGRHFLHASAISFALAGGPPEARLPLMRDSSLASGTRFKFEADLPAELAEALDGLDVVDKD